MRKHAFVLASIFAATFALPAQSKDVEQGNVEDLLNPTYMAGALCGQTGQAHGTLFKLPETTTALKWKFWERSTSNPDNADGPPLWDNLGDYSYAITTKEPLAQQYFDQGLRLTYGFNHFEAIRAFKKAQELDPTCAMCFWGEAFSWGSNLNLPMLPDAVEPAYLAVTRARELSDGVSEKEQHLIKALSKRYSPDPKTDRAKLDSAFADAMEDVASKYPNDADINTIYADSLMNLSPWDYWERDQVTPKGRQGGSVAVIEKALNINPNHTGAIHLYIHAVEASNTPDRAEPYADRLASLMPGSGHLVHMPSHIYYRVGRFKDSVDANADAVEADEEYFSQVKAEGIYPFVYYPHNVHFLMASALMAGDKKRSLRSADKLAGLIPDAFAALEPTAQPIKLAPYYAMARFGDPAEILALEKPSEETPLIVAIWHYARGEALIKMGDIEKAQAEGSAIEAIQDSGALDDLVDRLVPGPTIAEVAINVLAARMAQAQGEKDETVAFFEKAVAAQDSLNYTEPPYWYYPIRQSLGAAQIAAGHPDKAKKTLQDSLMNYPNNAWALFALSQAQKATGDIDAAKVTQKMFRKAWAGRGVVIELGEI